MQLLSIISLLAGLFCLQYSGPLSKHQPTESGSVTSKLISDIEIYEDADYGFSVAVPTGWTRIVAAQPPSSQIMNLEQGHAVGFETGRQGSADRFADYILIEVLPGDDSGAFAANEDAQRWMSFDDQLIAYQEVYINSDEDPNVDVDLIIYQREVRALGYTVGFYAIGEPVNQKTLFDAFQIMLRTYYQQHDPFSVASRSKYRQDNPRATVLL